MLEKERKKKEKRGCAKKSKGALQLCTIVVAGQTKKFACFANISEI